MDITQLFKACTKTVRLRNRNLGIDKNKPTDKNRKQSNENKLIKDEHVFFIQSKNVCIQLTQLRNFLIENRAAYMKFACHLKRSAHMTDDVRDLIDRESEKILNNCIDKIDELRNDHLGTKKLNKQLNEHMTYIIELLINYHKGVYKIYSDQKKYRVRRDIEAYKFLKLDSNKKRAYSKPRTNEREELMNNDENNDNFSEISVNGSNSLRNRKNNMISKLSLDDEIITNNNQNPSEENGLSAEDIQMFESENVQLLSELQGLSEEVEQIEKNVVDIVKLQEMFSEKVTLQQQDIDRIANTVVGATENVRDANEQIKQAIQRNAGLRVYVLFFLIVMSFSLLFLDWYND